jgi:hypothetical protein
MKRLRQILLVALPTAVVLGGCCGLSLYWLMHQRMQDNPAAVYRCYKAELHRYAERLQAGEVRYVEGRGYGIPQFLIDHGARYVVKKGDCYVVIFGFMPTDAVPELWFSPNGFDPLPLDLETLKHGKGYFHWEQLSSQWGACLWDQ